MSPAPVGGIVTVSGAAVGSDPYGPRSWSGSSRFLLSALERRQALTRAIGARASGLARARALARNFSPSRAAWRNRLYLDVSYRNALTTGVRRALTPEDLDHPFVQIAGYYDVPAALPRPCPCFAYYDGNLAIRLRAPYPLEGVGEHAATRALAYERRLLARMRGVFTMSDYLRESFIEDYGVAPDRVHAIGGGVNLDSLPAPDPARHYDGREILFVGVDFARKGGWVLLEAFQSVRTALPGARLHVVGPAPFELDARLAPGVEQHGFLESGSATLAGLFARCSVFAMPSLYEAFGIAPLEAMLHGIPAVVTGDWALRETVVDGSTGVHVRAGDAGQLAAVLISLMRQPQRLREMGEAAQAHVRGRYTWEAVVERMLDAIASSP